MQQQLRRVTSRRAISIGLSALFLLGLTGIASALTHTVKKGDTCSKIALRYHVPLKSLLHANGLRTRSIIRPGQRLNVPVKTAQATPAKQTTPTAAAKQTTPTAAAKSTTQGQTIVNTAMRYQGVRYRYGGMSSRGLDCSGLVARVLKDHGIRVPHNARALYAIGTPVKRADLKPGDLVFFHTTRAGISHVGIFIGNGKFTHASSGNNHQVRIDSLSSKYYNSRYVGARRLD
jgi:cell wall-associated NlpC family hydrolase